MNGWLLDTNVLSELRRPKPDARVVRFVSAQMFIAAFASSAQSANGDFQFALSGASGSLQFNARVHGNSARGNLTLTATQDVSTDAVDDAGGPGAAPTTATIEVSIDCLRQSGKRASMSGLVTASNVPGYTGRRAILAVEDAARA